MLVLNWIALVCSADDLMDIWIIDQTKIYIVNKYKVNMKGHFFVGSFKMLGPQIDWMTEVVDLLLVGERCPRWTLDIIPSPSASVNKPSVVLSSWLCFLRGRVFLSRPAGALSHTTVCVCSFPPLWFVHFLKVWVHKFWTMILQQFKFSSRCRGFVMCCTFQMHGSVQRPICSTARGGGAEIYGGK